jgi:hypothetical protein
MLNIEIMAKIIPMVLYFIVGVISLSMAWKNLFSKGLLPFHEEAIGKSLGKLDQKVGNVILALMRTTGLGFLVVGLLLVFFPAINHFESNTIVGFGIPFISGIYCFGLFLANYWLHNKSGVETPWKASLIAVAIIAIGITVSIL